MAAHHLQGVGGDPDLEGGVAGRLGDDDIAQERRHGGQNLAGRGLILHRQAASRRIRSISVSEVRRAITARSTVGSTVRNDAVIPEHMIPQRRLP